MFLDRLNNEEKTLFIDMAFYTVQCNGIVEESETELLMQYCKELDVVFDETSKRHPLEEIKIFFSSVAETKKRIVLVELLGLCYIDGDFDNVEKAFISDFAIDIGIEDDIFQKLNQDVKDYLTILGIIKDHIDE